MLPNLAPYRKAIAWSSMHVYRAVEVQVALEDAGRDGGTRAGRDLTTRQDARQEDTRAIGQRVTVWIRQLAVLVDDGPHQAILLAWG